MDPTQILLILPNVGLTFFYGGLAVYFLTISWKSPFLAYTPRIRFVFTAFLIIKTISSGFLAVLNADPMQYLRVANISSIFGIGAQMLFFWLIWEILRTVMHNPAANVFTIVLIILEVAFTVVMSILPGMLLVNYSITTFAIFTSIITGCHNLLTIGYGVALLGRLPHSLTIQRHDPPYRALFLGFLLLFVLGNAWGVIQTVFLLISSTLFGSLGSVEVVVFLYYLVTFLPSFITTFGYVFLIKGVALAPLSSREGGSPSLQEGTEPFPSDF